MPDLALARARLKKAASHFGGPSRFRLDDTISGILSVLRELTETEDSDYDLQAFGRWDYLRTAGWDMQADGLVDPDDGTVYMPQKAVEIQLLRDAAAAHQRRLVP